MGLYFFGVSMKWFYLTLSYIMKRFAGVPGPNPIEEIKELIKENAVKILLVITLATTLGSFFVVGITLTLYQFITQYQLGESLSFNPINQVGVGMIILSFSAFLIAYLYAFKHEREVKKIEAKRANQGQLNTFQDALMLLVQDYIAERESKREHATTFGGQTMRQNAMNPDKSPEAFERH